MMRCDWNEIINDLESEINISMKQKRQSIKHLKLPTRLIENLLVLLIISIISYKMSIRRLRNLKIYKKNKQNVVEYILKLKFISKEQEKCYENCNNFEKKRSMRVEDLFTHYLTRGGFIQDCHGTWCKEGDKVFLPTEYGTNICCIIKWDKDVNRFYFVIKDNGDLIDGDSDFELIEPCEPDACKDFKGE